MAVVEGTGIAQTAGNAASTIWTLMLWVLLIGLIAGLAFMVWWIMSYRKKRIVLFEKLSNGWQKKEYSAKEIRAKDGGLRWKIFKQRRQTPRPPSTSIMTDDKKRMIAYGFIIEDNIVWANLTLNADKKALESISFDPLVAEDKNLYINEVEAAEKYRRKKLLDVLQQALPFITFIILLALVFAFWGSITEPTLTANSQNIQIIEKQTELVEKMDALINNKQSIGGSTTDTEGVNQSEIKPPN